MHLELTSEAALPCPLMVSASLLSSFTIRDETAVSGSGEQECMRVNERDGGVKAAAASVCSSQASMDLYGADVEQLVAPVSGQAVLAGWCSNLALILI